jgi:hypothetical protein
MWSLERRRLATMVSETFVANGATRIAHGEKRMYTRIQDRSVDEIAARANQYLEGESGAEEFRERLLRAIAHADEDALIFLAKAIADNAEEID